MTQATYPLAASIPAKETRSCLAARASAAGGAWGVRAGCALILVGFFLPWVEGDGAFALRSFSGLDLAAILRNFAAATHAGGPVVLVPLLLYLVPASAASAGVLSALSRHWRLPPLLERLAVGGSAVYALLLLAAVLLLSSLPVSAAAPLLESPSWGFATTTLGALVLLRSALTARR